MLKSTIDRDIRNLRKQKSDRIRLKSGDPVVSQMSEGIPEFYKSEHGNIVEWIKFDNRLYKNEFFRERIGNVKGAKSENEGTEFYFPNGMIFHIGTAYTTNTSTEWELDYEFPNKISYVFVCEHDASFSTESRGFPIDDVRDKIQISCSSGSGRNHVYLVIGN